MLLVTMVYSAAAVETCPIFIPDQKQKEYGDSGWFLHKNQMVAQSFKPTKGTLSKVDLFISKQGDDPEYGITVSIRDDLLNEDLTSKDISYYWGDKNYAWISFDFNDITVEPGNTYFIVASSEAETNNCYGWICAEDDEAYPDGSVYLNTNDEGWEIPEPPQNDPRDCCFITYSPFVKSYSVQNNNLILRISKLINIFYTFF